MIRLVLSALSLRRAQALTVLLLTTLAVAAAAAAPWYLTASARAVARADVASAPVAQRMLILSGVQAVSPGAGGVGQPFARRADDLLELRAESRVMDVRMSTDIRRPGGSQGGYLVARDDVCAHLVLTGDCPDEPGEVAVSRRDAEEWGIAPGGKLTSHAYGSDPLPLRVTAVYEPKDPLGAYWAGNDMLGGGAQGAAEPLFAVEGTLLAAGVRQASLRYEVTIAAAALYSSGADVADRLARARSRSQAAGLTMTTNAAGLADLVRRDQQLITLGVTAAALELIGLCWFVLYFAVAHTAAQRRPDLALLRLRGAAGWRVWTVTVAQSAVPMLAGLLGGYGGGYLLARALGGELDGPADVRGALLRSALAGAGVVVGALVVAIAAEWRAARAPVVELLRRVPARRRWRADAVDLILVALAAAGVYQAYATGSHTEPTWLSLLAPGLLALAVALVAARLAAPLAARLGTAALRAGRVGTALASAQLARRPGANRVFALVGVAVALLVTAALSMQESRDARAARAAEQVGADRVLSVRAQGLAELLAGVRSADPTGRYAMAVARFQRTGDGPGPVLAVDAPRLAAVAAWPAGVDGTPAPAEADLHGGGFGTGHPVAAVASALRPPVPESVRLRDGPLTLEAAGDPGPLLPGADMLVRAHLATAAGRAVTVTFGPFGAERATRPARLSGCAADGCRLLRLESLAQSPGGPRIQAPAGARVDLYRLTGPGGVAISPEAFGDPLRWRGSYAVREAVPALEPADGRLRIVAQPDNPRLGKGSIRSTAAYLTDAPVPVPLVVAGRLDPPDVLGDPRLGIFGATAIPYRLVASVQALPSLGRRGSMVDLEMLARSLDGPAGDQYEVWLAPGAPTALRDRLAAAGLPVIGEDSIAAARDRMAGEGPPAALRFRLLAAVFGVLLAAGALAVAGAVERATRAGELTALRRQGLPAAAARRVAYGGQLPLVVLAALTGAVTAVIARYTVEIPLPLFVSGWGGHPRTTIPPWAVTVLAALAALAVLGAVATVAARGLAAAAGANGSTGRSSAPVDPPGGQPAAMAGAGAGRSA
ncbi:FtsX-like permease family protein [Rhizomonospora bruguierae]|uniref:FtsX-like permease family protein n=1 Tax=Rhizomonospora bruguierae TaxID=1581705 RepID=UPI001BCB8CBF|nr:FtsX-like permease family protein [Micromonospora sp. NBRC 107566]